VVGLAAHAFGLKAAAIIPMVGVGVTAIWLRFFTPIGRADTTVDLRPDSETRSDTRSGG